MHAGRAVLALAALLLARPAAAQEQDFLFLGDTAFLQERGVPQVAFGGDFDLRGAEEPAGAQVEAEVEYGISDELQIALAIPYRFGTGRADGFGAAELEIAARLGSLGEDGHLIAATALQSPDLGDSDGV